MPKDIASEIRELGLKLTPQRIEIIEILKDIGDTHPSLNTLYDEAKRRMPSVSFSTLYNTISTLEKHGYLSLMDLDGETRVEMNSHFHINVIDKRTGEISDIEDEALVQGILKGIGRDKDPKRKVMINVIIE